MIGRLTGEVAHIAEDHVLLGVGGVGYVVYCSSRTLGGLPPVGEGARLYTCLLYTSPSPRDLSTSRMPSSA